MRRTAAGAANSWAEHWSDAGAPEGEKGAGMPQHAGGKKAGGMLGTGVWLP